MGRSKKRHSSSDVAAKLNLADQLVRAGASAKSAAASLGVSTATYRRWRRRFNGMNAAQVSQLRALQIENLRLRRMLEDLKACGNLVLVAIYSTAMRLSPAMECLEAAPNSL